MKIAIKHQQELEKQYNGLNEKEFLKVIKSNNITVNNYEKGEYVDIETKHFTTTYNFKEQQLQRTGIQYWNNEDQFTIIDLDKGDGKDE